MASQVESIKWVPGTDFIVDGFAFQSPRCSHYFLTHFHSDHTIGLNKSFDGGVIFCSPVTARLLVHDMGLKPQVVKPLAVGTPAVIRGVRVTPLDANHCPGAVMFLFEVPLRGQGTLPWHTPQAAPGPGSKAEGLGRSWQWAAVGSSSATPRPPRGAASGNVKCSGASPGDDGSSGVAAEPTDVGFCSDVVSGNGQCEDAVAGTAAEGADLKGLPQGPTAAGPGAPAWRDNLTGAGRADANSGEHFWTDGPTHNILHTGDCRWQTWMRHQPGLAGVRVDTLFLDTTYAAPRHTLPPQEEAISMMVQAMREALAEEPLTLFVVAAYHIGKERAFLGAAQQLGAKVWCSASKRAVLRLLDLPLELTRLLVNDPRQAAVHVGSWGLRPEDLQAYLDRHAGVWKRILGVRPTGWTLRRSGGVSVRREGNVAIIGVPYSEHSSWSDLCDAVSQLRPRRLVPTVNATTPEQRRALVDRFARLMDLSADRSRLDVYLSRRTSSSSSLASGDRIVLSKWGGGSEARTAACRVDLEAVDLGEQERILAELQQRRQLLAPCRPAPATAAGLMERKRQVAAVKGTASEPRKRRRSPIGAAGLESTAAGAAGERAPFPPLDLEAEGEQREDEGCRGTVAWGSRHQAVWPAGVLAGVSVGGLRAVTDTQEAGPADDEAGGTTAAAAAAPCANRLALVRNCVSSSSTCVIDLTSDEERVMQPERAEAWEGCASGCGLVQSAGAGAGAVRLRRSCERHGGATPLTAVPQKPAAYPTHSAASAQSSIRRFFAPTRRPATGAIRAVHRSMLGAEIQIAGGPIGVLSPV